MSFNVESLDSEKLLKAQGLRAERRDGFLDGRRVALIAGGLTLGGIGVLAYLTLLHLGYGEYVLLAVFGGAIMTGSAILRGYDHWRAYKRNLIPAEDYFAVLQKSKERKPLIENMSRAEFLSLLGYIQEEEMRESLIPSLAEIAPDRIANELLNLKPAFVEKLLEQESVSEEVLDRLETARKRINFTLKPLKQALILSEVFGQSTKDRTNATKAYQTRIEGFLETLKNKYTDNQDLVSLSCSWSNAGNFLES